MKLSVHFNLRARLQVWDGSGPNIQSIPFTSSLLFTPEGPWLLLSSGSSPVLQLFGNENIRHLEHTCFSLGGQQSWESSLSGRSQLKNKPLFSNTWHTGAGIPQYSLYGLFSWTLINCQWEDLIFVKSNLRFSGYHVPVMVRSRGKKFYLTACAETQGACAAGQGDGHPFKPSTLQKRPRARTIQDIDLTNMACILKTLLPVGNMGFFFYWKRTLDHLYYQSPKFYRQACNWFCET